MFLFKASFFRGKENQAISWEDPLATSKIANELFGYLPIDESIPILFICIGTDRSTGDSLGPLVGTLLQEKLLPENFYVFGTLEDPIHAVNLEEKLNQIQKKFEQAFIIGIDACLGQTKSIGTIQIKKGSLKPGAGVNKTLPPVGHIHMTGVVNISGFMEFFVLQNTRLYLVMNLAKTISNGIYKAGILYQFGQNNQNNDLLINEDTV
jgi:putative sporulation protein YyaC